MESISSLRNEIIKLPNLDNSSILLYMHTFNELINIYDIELLNYVFYNEKKYIHDEATNIYYRKDYKFKKDVKYRYNESCIITGNDMDSCDIAHIVPFCDSTEFEKYDVDNGLILSKDLHALFDKNLLKINPDTLIIEISPEKLQNKKNTCNQYHGLKINVNLTKNTIQYLRRIYNY